MLFVQHPIGLDQSSYEWKFRLQEVLANYEVVFFNGHKVTEFMLCQTKSFQFIRHFYVLRKVSEIYFPLRLLHGFQLFLEALHVLQFLAPLLLQSLDLGK